MKAWKYLINEHLAKMCSTVASGSFNLSIIDKFLFLQIVFPIPAIFISDVPLNRQQFLDVRVL